MRTLVLMILFIISNCCIAQVGKVSVTVFDEFTNVLADTEVSASFSTLEKAWHAGPSNRFKKNTNNKGFCSIVGHGNGGSCIIYVTRKEYYHSYEEIHFKNKVGIGRLATWQPWNSYFKIYLTKIDNPTPMYARRLVGETLPVLQEKVGYDFRKGDWVYDGYTGEHIDIYFHYKDLPLKEIIANGRKMMATYNRKMTISFPNDGDGIIPVDVPDFRSKGLILPKIAPENGYKTNLIKTSKSGQLSTYKISENYFIRVNTEIDEQGNIIKANYGKIYRGFRAGNAPSITYYLNPTPNDRNVECDRNTNLIVNLPERERPWKP